MKQLADYKMPFKTNELKDQVLEFFSCHNNQETANHSIEVAEEAKKLAPIFGLDTDKAFVAGLLHDIGAVIPNEDRIPLQLSLNEPVFEEEEVLPMILHQKQAVFLAKEVFGMTDLDILSAIECHTTLKKQATPFDKLIFIADKKKWDRKDRAPYLDGLEKALSISLDEACKSYFNWAKDDFVVCHPWAKDAMDEIGISF